jgi:hypothetical protein
MSATNGASASPSPRKPREPGFARTFSADSAAVSTKCLYCGESFVGPDFVVRQFEEQHRPRCERPKQATAAEN